MDSSVDQEHRTVTGRLDCKGLTTKTDDLRRALNGMNICIAFNASQFGRWSIPLQLAWPFAVLLAPSW